ncbi:MAG: sugar phosphate nucleotidyltransferase [Thermodesulfobacteriota bacterium]
MKARFNAPHKSNHRSGKVTSEGHRWGIILAGGDGTRLRSLTRIISGDERPKQFCHILGDESLLERTVRRVESGIPRSNILLSVTRTHEKFYGYLFDKFERSRFVDQPANLGTAPAILYSLLRIAKVDPDASVTFFPSDHYLSDDCIFMKQVETAFEGIERQPGMIVLLGITPSSAETEYGWIEPCQLSAEKMQSPLKRVKRFWEKPDKSRAAELFDKGCLWNSFVMTGKVSSFLEMIGRSVPALYRDFLRVSDTIGTPEESDAIDYIYERLTPANFSHRVLEVSTEDLLTLAVKDVEWSDLGEPGRVLSTLENIGIMTEWSHKKGNLTRKIA